MTVRLDASILRVKAATRDLVKACGGVERAAFHAGFGKSQVSRWQSPESEDVIPIRAFLNLQRECGLTCVTDVLAVIGAETKGEAPPALCEKRIMEQHSAAVATLAGIVAQFAVAMADGKVTGNEAALLDPLVSAANRALEDLRDTYADMRAEG